jgi:uroporphyrinogen decarboxylase
LVVPLLGYPGARLTDSTLRQNAFNSDLHFASIYKLVERFEPDAIFFMMDLSIEAGALGLQVRYPLDESPSVENHPVAQIADLDRFRVLDPLKDARLQSYLETMRLMAARLRVIKGGYICGPFTLAGLMMGATEIALGTVDDPELVLSVVDFATEVVIRYGEALVDAGADLIAILEPSASLLSAAAFTKFASAPISRVVHRLPVSSILHVCGNTRHLASAMAGTGAQGLSLDASVDFSALAAELPSDIVLVGNVDPVRVMRDADPSGVRVSVRELLDTMEAYPNFILSTGCDIPPDTPFDNIAAFMAEGRAAG